MRSFEHKPPETLLHNAGHILKPSAQSPLAQRRANTSQLTRANLNSHTALGQLEGDSPQQAVPTQAPTPAPTQTPTEGGRIPPTITPEGIRIETETFLPAANGTSDNSRRTIGVGEAVTFTSNRRGTWNIPGNTISGQPRVVPAFFQQPGIQRISLQTRRGTARLSIRVVAPHVRVSKVRDIQIEELQNSPSFPRGSFAGAGVAMQLQFRLTPLNVSFAGLEFKEHNNQAESLSGYYEQNPDMAKPHRAARQPALVNADNNLNTPDNAGFSLHFPDMNWPITRGSYRWRIPQSYRINGASWQRLANPMVETFHLNPISPISRPPYRGSMIVWKGGQRAERTYT